MNRNLPPEIAEILDDPIEDGDIFVKKVDCLTFQKEIEHRLTKLETMNWRNLLAEILTFIAVIAALWKLFGG